MLGALPSYTPATTERFVSKREFIESEVYNDMIVPTRTDIVHNLVLTFPFGGDSAAVSLMRGKRAEPYGTEEERLLSTIGPHLIRLVTIRHDADAARRRREHFASDVGENCRFALDWSGRLHEINRAAARMLASGRLVHVVVSQSLSWWHADDSKNFDRLVSRAGRLNVGGSLTVHDREGVAYHLILDVARTDMAGMNVDEAPLLVTVVNLPALVDRQVDSARQLFGLSPSEIALATSMMLGRTIEEHADRRGSTRETVRKQLAALFRKVGVSRQAALVALLFGLPSDSLD